jgi:hypothetical protein
MSAFGEVLFGGCAMKSGRRGDVDRWDKLRLMTRFGGVKVHLAFRLRPWVWY